MRTSRLPVNMAEQLAVGPGNRELGPENPVVPAVRVALAVLESRVVPAVQVALAATLGFPQLSVRFARCYRHSFNDGFLFSHPWSAPKVRPQLSLSLPRFERDFHHADSRDSVEGKVKLATYRWRSADQRRYRARFNELEFRPARNFKQILD